ncbi:DUF2946 family protein [Pararobbsia alpina]|uniref:DUF2946 domain-containing protein n=1 Tax=Pararobbsia alpina TaxID=621374 RepID=A0A6S7C3M1_9BURK|nr:DUF2946 family protein [Pararobbsia alpina]CAB3780299.1 hypothetical protein LMG28138_01009 [Pararobbsia alpina]
MDDIVRQALAKWPNVPACYGWLLLDRRGNWRMRDEVVQRDRGLGTPIRHAALSAFIVRNYDVDANGQWYFQNGPQRVYVELEYAPWVVRLLEGSDGKLALTDQTGADWDPDGCWLDDQGAIVFSGHAAGDRRERVGVLHDHDLDLFADRLEDRETMPVRAANLPNMPRDDGQQHFMWQDGTSFPVQSIRAEELGQRFGFVASPAQRVAGLPP